MLQSVTNRRRLKKPRFATVVGGVEAHPPPQEATLEALGALYERGFHKYLRVAEAIVGDVDRAHEVVQEAFARAIRSRSRFCGSGTLEGWLWKTVVNTARSNRADSARIAFEELEEEPPAHDHDGGRTALRSAVAELPERQRLVLFLRYYADLDYRRIGDALGIEPGTVGATLNQAHTALRRVLEGVAR